MIPSSIISLPVMEIIYHQAIDRRTVSLEKRDEEGSFPFRHCATSIAFLIHFVRWLTVYKQKAHPSHAMNIIKNKL